MTAPPAAVPPPDGGGETVTLAHGGGGQAMHELIERVFAARFDGGGSDLREDSALLALEQLSGGRERLAFTTDSYVVDPLFFPGGDIGMLAVNGTVNDLAVSGAVPLYLSCSVIIEEGLPLNTLRRVVCSMQAAAERADVRIVTGDTKVVHRGAADKLFVNTAGIGLTPAGVHISAAHVRPGDCILLNGCIGDHGAAILAARGELALDNPVETDCQPLGGLVRDMLAVCPDIRAMRDATRGGVAAVLNEFVRAANCCMCIDESALPMRESVRGMCEILGLDPLYLANEGKLVCVAPSAHAEVLLQAMRAHPAGGDAALIGEVTARPEGMVLLRTGFGGERVIDMPVGEQLPRIC